jgi:hypothetical protein
MHLLFEKNSPQNGEQDAEQKAGGQRKVKGKSTFLDMNVSGKPTHYRQFAKKQQKRSRADQSQAHQEQKLASNSKVHR